MLYCSHLKKFHTSAGMSLNLHYYFKGELRRKMNLGLIAHCYLVNLYQRFVFMIIECKEFYL